MNEIFTRHDLFQRGLFLDKLNFHGNKIHNILYDDLVALKNESLLVPGMKYRIINYVTTTSQTNTTSAGKLFDVIVTALTEDTLDENASCCATARQNPNVSSSKSSYWHPERWTIKYSLLGNSEYTWCNSTTPGFTGLIYYMKDEYENESFFDFKNIKFSYFYYVKKEISTAAQVKGWTSTAFTTMCNRAASSTYRYMFNKFPDYNYTSESSCVDGSLYGCATGNKVICNTDSAYETTHALPFVMMSFNRTCTNNIFYNCHNINLEAYSATNSSDTVFCYGIDHGLISSNIFTSCDSLYILASRIYNYNLFNSGNCCFKCYGSDAECYTYNMQGCILNSCLYTLNALKSNTFFRNMSIYYRGTSLQTNDFRNQASNIYIVNENASPTGYTLYNTFMPNCSNLAFSCAFNMSNIFGPDTKYLTVNYSGTASFNNCVKNLEVYGTNFGTSNTNATITAELGKDYVQRFVKDGSKTIMV